MNKSNSESEKEAHEKQVNDELRLLYTSCVSELATFKQQQWITTNYGIAAYAAIFPLSNNFKTSGERHWLLVLAVLILVAGVAVIRGLDGAIEVRRDRQKRVRRHFTQEFMTARGDAVERKSFSWLFYAVFIVGFLITVRLLW